MDNYIHFRINVNSRIGQDHEFIESVKAGSLRLVLLVKNYSPPPFTTWQRTDTLFILIGSLLSLPLTPLTAHPRLIGHPIAAVRSSQRKKNVPRFESRKESFHPIRPIIPRDRTRFQTLENKSSPNSIPGVCHNHQLWIIGTAISYRPLNHPSHWLVESPVPSLWDPLAKLGYSS